MLAELKIDGLGVITAATAAFHAGLTVLTGETGAGKTMVVTGLHLLSGARADPARVRLGRRRAIVEGRFSTAELSTADVAEVDEVLDSGGGERDEDGSIIAVRTVGSDGRSRAYLGGRVVPVGTLGAFTDALLTVHGQNDQLRLQRSDRQRDALDSFASATIAPLLADYRTARGRWLAARAELAKRSGHSREMALEAAHLTRALAEIDGVAPEPDEDVAIVAEVRRLSELDSLREAAGGAHAALAGSGDGFGDPTGVLDGLGAARARLETGEDPALVALVPRMDEAIAVLSDVTTELGAYLADLPADPSRLDSLLTRQAELKTLTRKYAPDIRRVVAWADDARERLAALDVSDDALAELTAGVEAAGDAVRVAAEKLSAARTAAAAELAEAVSAELVSLAMGQACLHVQVRSLPAGDDDSAPLTIDGATLHAGEAGVDEVDFRLAAHSGAQALPLSKSASGGELSRVMLALEVVLAQSRRGTTMVFDEVDAGIGGRAAVEVGRRLARLARTHQVIVVTHLPQVAAFADTHLVVDKSDVPVEGEGVSSRVHVVRREERVVELARMLAGLDDTETGRAHAEELLEMARTERQVIPGNSDAANAPM